METISYTIVMISSEFNIMLKCIKSLKKKVISPDSNYDLFLGKKFVDSCWSLAKSSTRFIIKLP